MFDTFTGGVVVPGSVSYLALALSANTSLSWPSFAAEGQNVVASIIEVTPSAGGFVLSMPDAKQAGTGSLTVIRNLGAFSFDVNDAGGNNLGTIAAGVAKLIYLQDNSTSAGSWGIFTYGTGTSAADASALAGQGLQALSGQLAQAHVALTSAGALTIDASHLATNVVFTGGSVACTLPTSSSAGSDFFVLVKNAGTGTITLTPSGGDTIDGAASVAMAPNDACMVLSLGAANQWVTLGLGRAVSFAFTQLVLNVAGGVDVTETSSQAANKVQTYTGLLTASINVIVPNTVSVYYVYNNTSGAFNLAVKTAAGSGISVTQGTRDVLVCDGTDVKRALDNVSATTVFSAGSAASPSVAFVGNVSTGLYIPSANTLGIAANGLEVATFASVASSVNWFTFTSAAAANPPTVSVDGQVNVHLGLKAKGAGRVSVLDSTDSSKGIRFDPSGLSAGTFTTLQPVAAGTMYIAASSALLTSGRIPLVTTGGLLTDNAAFTYQIISGRSIIVTNPDAGADVGISAINTTNTAGAEAFFYASVGGAAAGDAFINLIVNGAQNWAIGVDNSDSDAFVIAASLALGTNNALRISTTGQLTVPGSIGSTGSLATSTYTPTPTNVTNLSGSNVYTTAYARVGSFVVVGGRFDINPAVSANPTELGLSLPIASNFTAFEDAFGVCWQRAAGDVSARGFGISADTVNDRLSIYGVPNHSGGMVGYTFIAGYIIK